MAGNYPDAPALRMAYDRDGTVGLVLNTTTPTVLKTLSAGEMATLNDEDVDSISAGGIGADQNWGVCLIFPELRTLSAYMYSPTVHVFSIAKPLQTSVDTTNGLDGTWSSHSNTACVSGPSTPIGMRTSVTSVSHSGIKAVRFIRETGNSSNPLLYNLHVFGSTQAGQNPNRLRIWHPTLDQEVGAAYFDWADVAQGTSADRTFRVKNNSATLTANSISLTLGAPTDTTPSVPGQHLLSQDGSNFAASQNIGGLAPGGISPVITLRRVTPSNAVFSVWWARVLAVAASWT